ncbi:hypothetical protein [Carboxylicivirga caseinilyticus]|uniref:hypothetical protein n=1 Tax=Carboxylicivirga caseinilyticus TaxID=3417572 RepID=UPI003D348E01|nr:hypothetical protein [Marinilabiliaceae bacterium A049]
MSFFKKIGKAIGGAVKGVGRFAKKIATSGIGKTILGVAATAVGGPLAGAGITALTKSIGKTKAGAMVSKVVSEGVVKVDKVVTTLQKAGIEPKTELVNSIVTGVKAAAEGIAEKPINTNQTTKQALSSAATMNISEPYTTANASTSTGSLMDKVKVYWQKLVNWVKMNWKKLLLFAVLPLGVVVALVYFLKPKSNRRKRRR